MLQRRSIPAVSLAVFLAVLAACGTKHPPTPAQPPSPELKPTENAPPPKPAAPVIAQFTAEPTSILIGQSSTLRWQVTGDVSGVTIDQTIGTVQNTGSRRVFPSRSTTYMLTATGPGGGVTSSVTVRVAEAPAPPPPPQQQAKGPDTFAQGVEANLQDVYFDYDQSEIGAAGQAVLTKNAAALKSLLADFPNAVIMVEGHCDERGSAEYNLALGDRRAGVARDYLVELGVPASRIRTISYGKERPQCTESDEACWQKNRRAHFSPGQ